MEKIEQRFVSLASHLRQVLQCLEDGQFLTESVCSEMFRLVDEVRQEQKHCVQTLQDAGVENPVCSSIMEFRTQLETCQRRTAERQIAKARQVMEEFLSVFSVSGTHTAKLDQLFRQFDLSDENALLSIVESGDLAQYQAFLDFVRAGIADYAAVEPLTRTFGYDLAFALMGGDLRMGSLETSAEEKDPETDVPGGQEPEQEAETQPEQKGMNVSGDATAGTASVLLMPVQPIREQKPTVEGFRKVLGKLPLEARAILPALSQFGALTLELAVRIGIAIGWKDTQQDETAYRIQIDKVLQDLEKKGFVARYETEVGAVFCLTTYGFGCLHRPKVHDQAKQFFSIPVERRGTSFRTITISVGQHNVIAQAHMESAILYQTIAEVRKLCEYVEWIRRRAENAEEICSSLIWRGDHYEMKAPCADGTALLRVCFNPEPGENVLYMTETVPTPCPATGSGVWFSGDSLLYWDAAQAEWENLPTSEKPETKESELETAGQGAEPQAVMEPESHSEPGPTAEIGAVSETPAEPAPEPDHERAPSCARECAQAFLTQDTSVLPGQLLTLTVRLLGEERFAEANALAETIALDPGAPKWAKAFYQTFRQALQVPGSSYQYSSRVINELQNALPSEELELQSLQQSMVCSILLWAMAFPSDHYDHDLYNHSKMVLGNNADDSIRSLIELLSEELKGVSFQYDGYGLSPMVLNGLSDDKKRKQQLAALQKKASSLKKTPTSTVGITGLETCLKQLVGPTSPIGKAIQSVEKDDRTQAEAIQAMLEELFQGGHSDQAQEDYIDQTWSELRRIDSRVKLPKLNPDTPARKQCKKALSDRLDVIQQWLSLITAEQGADFERLRDRYARTVSKLKDALTELALHPMAKEDFYERAGQAVMRRTAKCMLDRLEGTQEQEIQKFFSPLWQTSELILSESGEHLVVKELYGVEGAEPWRLVLRAVAKGPEDLDEILDQISDSQYSPRWNHNYGTEKWVLESRGEVCPDRTAECQKAQKAAEEEVKRFQSQARLDWAEGKIQEHEKETAFAALETVKGYYFDAHNYASLLCFISMLQEDIERRARVQTDEYRKKARQLEKRYPGVPMLEAIYQALDRGSLLNAYSYIIQLENGITQPPLIEKTLEGVSSYLSEFQDCEEMYLQECLKHKSDSPANWGARVLERMPKHCCRWSSENEKKKGCEWLSRWITGYGNANTNKKIQDLLVGLGFQVNGVRRGNTVRTQTQHEVYEVSAERTSRGRTDYPHPIYKFGTQLTDPFYVVCLFGCRGANTLIDLMTNWLQLNGPTIVFMDGTLSVGDRRRVAETFKSNTSGQNAFLLIDRVLLLYLASLDEGSRLNAMLHCTLPYTFEMLYGNGVSTVPDEMFIGRTAAMNDLRSEQGSDLVYGGRQLGKTALLRRVSNTLDHPETGAYSFYVEVKDEGSDALLEKTNQRLIRLGLLQGPEKDTASLCRTLRTLYEDGKLKGLRIFVDESDQLFEEFSQDSFRSLRPFIELRNETAHHVKFVFAGTHNVAAMDKANDDNGNLVHMKSLCIEPLSLADAVKLIRIPMAYLGFEIGDQEIDLILTNTNNYPGLIHMFCRALVQSVCGNYSTYYANQEKLPYRIEREQMQAVFKENDIRREMGIRVMATIKLNEKYKIISNLLALRIYEGQSVQDSRIFGYTAQELLDYNSHELDIQLLNQMSLQDMKTLLNEMCQMGILYKTVQEAQDEYYRFRQREFLQFIGSEEDVLNTLLPKGDVS